MATAIDPQSSFNGKCLLVTGGTGSFGRAATERFLGTGLRELRIFSRDELKQDEMRKAYSNHKLKFHIGDVRDYNSVLNAMRGVDFVFHAAALKQVPSCEFYPIEAVKTNVLGTENVMEAAIHCGVERVVCLSTDKAVHPVNAMGVSKAMMEKVMIAKARSSESTIISATRYGNVMASRGSVIPNMVRQIGSDQPITLTDPTMTRFMMTLDEAVDLVLFAFLNACSGEILVQKAPGASLSTVVSAVKHFMDSPEHPVKIIGTRHGEKKHEILLSREEMVSAEELGKFYRIMPDNRDLNYSSYFDEGDIEINEAEDYNSANTHQLDIDGMIELLKELNLDKANQT